MKLTKKQLYNDLYKAYIDAKKHISNKPDVIAFSKNLKQNLKELCDEIYEGRYKQLPLICFIYAPDQSNRREVFAARFRDKIVQHLLYNYVDVIFDKTFIYDSY